MGRPRVKTLKRWPGSQTLLGDSGGRRESRGSNTMIETTRRIVREFRISTNYRKHIPLGSAARTVT